MVRNILVALLLVILVGCGSMSTTTEKDVIVKADISSVSGYTDSIKKTVQVINVDLTKVLALYPSLQEKNVGLGFAESVLDYLDETNRFVFTEEKAEIKERMVTQFKASKKGIFEEPIDGKGKIKAAQYFVYVTVADFAVDEDETVQKGKSTVVVTTFIRLQVRFVNAKTGQIYIGSGEGESQKVGESFLKNLDMKFSQSTVGKATRKSLETACTKVIESLIKNGIFTK
jgi:curli biogenesis system outer membrane secretion channel CsgG